MEPSRLSSTANTTQSQPSETPFAGRKSTGTGSRRNRKKHDLSENHFLIYEDLEVSTVSRAITTTEMSTQTQHSLCSCICHESLQDSNDKTNSSTKDTNEEITRLVVQDDVPPEYWESLAERRQSALNDSLKENDELRDAIDKLTMDIANISTLASQAEYFENMIVLLTERSADANEKSEDESLTVKKDDTLNLHSKSEWTP